MVVQIKRSLFRLQQCHFKIREKFAFSKGLTHNFRQKLEILRNLFLFQKGLDGVLVKIEVCLGKKFLL